jgi:cytochrome b561
MFDPDRRKSYGVTSAILAWLIVFSYVACFVVSPAFSRLLGSDPAANYSGDAHANLGLLTLLLVVLRLLWWIKNQRPVAPKKMPEKAFSLSRFTLLLMYLNVLQLSVSGLLGGWSMGQLKGVLAMVSWPEMDAAVVEYASQTHLWGWQINAAVIAIYCLLNGYLAVRYKAGWRRMLPGVHL